MCLPRHGSAGALPHYRLVVLKKLFVHTAVMMTVLVYKTKADPWLECSAFPEVHVVQRMTLRAFLVRLGGQF